MGHKPSLESEDIEPLRIDEQLQDRIRNLGTKRPNASPLPRTQPSKSPSWILTCEVRKGSWSSYLRPVDTETLIAAVKRVTKMGDLERAVKDAQQDLAEHERGLTEEHLRLPLWSGSAWTRSLGYRFLSAGHRLSSRPDRSDTGAFTRKLSAGHQNSTIELLELETQIDAQSYVACKCRRNTTWKSSRVINVDRAVGD